MMSGMNISRCNILLFDLYHCTCYLCIPSLYSLYLQVHPDARSYRIKSIPYYSDLCKIYGNATAEKKGDCSILDAIAIFENKISGSRTADFLNGL